MFFIVAHYSCRNEKHQSGPYYEYPITKRSDIMCAAPKCQGEKRCEVKGGDQEMAVIISMANILIRTI